jgi:hypothetical protein
MGISAQAFNSFWLQLLALLWAHRDKLDDIGDLIGQITAALSAKDFATALDALYELAKLLIGIITAPKIAGVQAFADETSAVAQFEAARIGDGALLRKLRDFLNSPEGEILVDLLRKWFGF